MGRRNRGKPRSHQSRPALKADQDGATNAVASGTGVRSASSAPPQGISNPNKPEANVDQMIAWTAVVGRWTRFLTIATVVVGVVGIGATIRIGYLSDETQRSAQRPWIKFSDIRLLEPIHCEGQMVKAKVRLFLENGGNSPALHVDPRAFLDLSPESLISDKKIHESCDPIRQAKPNTGFASFPNSPPITDDIELSAKRLGLGPPILSPITIMACVTYRFSFGEGEGHQTGMMVNFGGPKHSENFQTDLGGLAVNCPPGTDIQTSTLDRTISTVGSYAD